MKEVTANGEYRNTFDNRDGNPGGAIMETFSDHSRTNDPGIDDDLPMARVSMNLADLNPK